MRKRETLFAIVTAASATIGIAGSGCNGSIYAGSAIDEDSGAARIDSGSVKDAAKDVGVDSPIDCDAAGPCDGDGCLPSEAPTSKDLDAEGGWNPPAPPSSVCTDGDLQTLGAGLAAVPIPSYGALRSGLSPACAACLFTDDNSANWSLILLDHTDEKNGLINVGACYATEIGDACGKAKQYFEFCLGSSCGSCSSDADFAVCEALPSVRDGCDANFGNAIATACGDDAGDGAAPYDSICMDPIQAAAVLCGGNAPDAG